MKNIYRIIVLLCVFICLSLVTVLVVIELPYVYNIFCLIGIVGCIVTAGEIIIRKL
jgi:hypothetical protein